jgi:hypothetical protein
MAEEKATTATVEGEGDDGVLEKFVSLTVY